MTLIRELWGPSGVILLAAILGAIGIFWAEIQKSAAERQLRGKSDEIAALNERIAGLVSGGDSFCYLMIASIDSDRNVGILTAVNNGKYPVFDVQARITDLQKQREKKGPIALVDALADTTSVNVASIPAQSASNARPLHTRGRR